MKNKEIRILLDTILEKFKTHLYHKNVILAS